MLSGTLVFAQSGGPTAVINSSVCGIIQTAKCHPEITRILGARYGVDGVLGENFVDVSTLTDQQIELLKVTPASAFGSCRHKLSEQAEYEKLLAVFVKYDVRFFVYVGGNDSMDTCNKISKFLQSANYQCCVVGVPKTIDNDLACTDHCPGYGSASKYIATSFYELSLDTAVYCKGRVTVVEVMGRDAGWLTASSALAGVVGHAPDLIYLPETNFDVDAFVQDCKAVMQKKGRCLVAVSEGIRNADGYVGASLKKLDAFNHVQLGGVAGTLTAILDSNGLKTRAVELSLMQRCASHVASLCDVSEAYQAGKSAVEFAVSGKSDVMVAICREESEKYAVSYQAVPLSNVANAVKPVPRRFINEKANGITQEFVDYALPLIQGETPLCYENGLPLFSTIAPDK